jgi:L-alanine-DL-glutamate epimerase-like enolase superfamily enzyme
MKCSVPIRKVNVSTFTIPTDFPEADGTFWWDKTTLVLIEIAAGNDIGVGYTYGDEAVASLVHSSFAKLLEGKDALANTENWSALIWKVRNLGRAGVCSMAISAVDNALWDLKAKLLGLPLAVLLGKCRDRVPIYGSGGFTTYSIRQLQKQLGGWAERGIGMVKMKIGSDPGADPDRVEAARESIGPEAGLFVDANGAYVRKEALAMAQLLEREQVSWFEEPVHHFDHEGLRLMRDRAPATMEISAGEYGFRLGYFLDLLKAGAVDVLQADATRCGITGFLQAATLCESYHIPLSSHCAPSLHIHPGCAATPVRHLEYFHDHVRIERMLFEGFIEPVQGQLKPDRSRPGLGLELREDEARLFRI